MNDQIPTGLRHDLHAYADLLEVPVPPTAAVLGRGRVLRRRRRTLGAAGVAAASVVLGGSLLLALPGGRDDSAPDPATPPRDAAVFAVGSDVYVDGTPVAVPGIVHSIHYTSAGVLVRSNQEHGTSDGSGPEELTLVGADGRSVDLGTVPEGHTPATDPGLPYYALAEDHDGRSYAVLRDVTSGDEVQRLPLPELPTGAWPAPPLTLSGDVVYADFTDRTYAVDWRTGDDVPVAVDSSEVHAGRVVSSEGPHRLVLDVHTGRTLLSVTPPKGAYGWLELSPDGGYALEFIEETADGSEVTSTQVYDVDTGTSVTLDGAPWELGWTPDGHLYRVDGDVVTTCSPATGACAEETVAIERVPEPSPVERTETTCDKHGENCGTMVWTETPDEPENKVTLAGRDHDS
ncbi:hypothetical protein J2X46_004373 [Nocardioides sp. BE266]|uniref:hypothetical protein n=1 Tax=Nocardioides sp. BE266 TaxID=2817725 RepID=UPI0028624BB0|nr:hypothetical protein [Nocardioides sp. BE266]MDR7255371.1 hypothetical protein [Nocardioides sp. BE266]